MPDQVHHQERHVGDRIGSPEPYVEFDAIHDRQVVGRAALRKQVDVIHPDVTMPVAGNAAIRSLLDQRTMPGQRFLG